MTVGRVRTYLCGDEASILGVVATFGLEVGIKTSFITLGSILHPREECALFSTCSIFPFCFGWQTVALYIFGLRTGTAQEIISTPCTECIGLLPTHSYYRVSVYKLLNTPMGIKKIDPSIEGYPSKEDPLTNYSKGCGENGAVFCHANTWAIIAECMLGNGNRAYQYYKQLLPMEAQARAGEWRYKAEPYVYSSNIMGPESLNFGLANVSWLSGTAAWMYIAVTQYIMGVKADFDGLTVTPCLPDEWQEVNVKRNFRNCIYNVEIKPSKNGKTYFEEDGKIFETNKIPHDESKQQRNIVFYYVK